MLGIENVSEGGELKDRTPGAAPMHRAGGSPIGVSPADAQASPLSVMFGACASRRPDQCRS